MLLSRSLPPQFLLPSWSQLELALAVQRSSICTTSGRRIGLNRSDAAKKIHRHGIRTLKLSPGGQRKLHNARRADGRCEIANFRLLRSRSQPPRRRIHGDEGGHSSWNSQPNPSEGERLKVGRKESIENGTSIKTQDVAIQEEANLEGKTRPGGSATQDWRGARWHPFSWKNNLPPEEVRRKYGHEEQASPTNALQPAEGLVAAPTHENLQTWTPLTPGPASPSVKTYRATARKFEATLTQAPPPPRKKWKSLFEELFPEEVGFQRQGQREAEERLEKLPAFSWDPDQNFLDNWEVERKKRREKYKAAGSRPASLVSTSISTQRTSKKSTSEQTESTLHKQQVKTSTVHPNPSVVMLEMASKYLVESDFFRVGPKGDHIENWTSGLLKVIPARDHATLEPLGYYYLLFSNDHAARAYIDNTYRLHHLGKVATQAKLNIPPPPGLLKDGENVKELLRGFSIVPRQNSLSMRLLGRPYTRHTRNVIAHEGPPGIANSRAKGDTMVLFSIDQGRITMNDIKSVISADGKRRNSHWRFAFGQRHVVLTSGWLGSQDERYKGPKKWILHLEDVEEARRFVRDWHRRQLEVPTESMARGSGERLPIVTAELLW